MLIEDREGRRAEVAWNGEAAKTQLPTLFSVSGQRSHVLLQMSSDLTKYFPQCWCPCQDGAVPSVLPDELRLR